MTESLAVRVAFGLVVALALAACGPPSEEYAEPVEVIGVTGGTRGAIQVYILDDGTRCARTRGGSGVAIDCDWRN